jgi:hypothetical protein
MPRTLHLTALDGNALLTRIAAQLGHHDVAHFDFRSEADGTARVVLGLRDPDAKVDLLARRLERLVSVLDVTAP